MEVKIDDLKSICTKIESEMKNYVPLTQVNSWIFRLTLLVVGLIVTLFIHILLLTRPVP